MKRLLTFFSLLAASAAFGQQAIRSLNGTFTATAYSQQGTTASGDYVHRHVVAADPDLLPIGSRIKIKRAGRYSGEYIVADTGRKIQGRRLDIFVPSTKACLRFGRKPVRVQVISVGDGTHAATKQADQAVKQDVKQDLSKNVVGNAATDTDWAVKKQEEQKGVPPAAATEKAAAAAVPPAATNASQKAPATTVNPQ